jgi:hypothetical protein
VKAYPFERLGEGRLEPEMVRETVEIVKTAIEKGVLVNLPIDNRAGGNAPLMVWEIAKKFLGKKEAKNEPATGSRGSLGISLDCKTKLKSYPA